MYFPMRVVVASDAAPAALTFRYKLIYNIAAGLTFPIASDLYAAPAFQDLLTREAAGQPTHWYRNFTNYLRVPRPRFELFDVLTDPEELTNLAPDPAWAGILAALIADCKAWQNATADDWVSKWVHE